MPLINGIAAGSDQNVGLLRMGAQRYRAYLGEILVYGERDSAFPSGIGKILTSAASPIVLAEGRQTSFTVQLDRQPPASTRLNITLAEHPRNPITLVTAARLRFTRGNWNTPQTVTIGAKDDSDVTDFYTSLTITGPANRVSNSVTRQVRVVNNDVLTPRLELSESALELGTGGDTDSFTARLTLAPTSTVTVAFSELANATTNPTSLTFGVTDWNAPQTVEVTSGADTGTETLTLTPSGGGVDGVAKTVDISIVTQASVFVSPDSLTLLEGETKELRVRVMNAPENYVVIVRVDENSPYIYAGPQLLTFTDARDQTVRVSAFRDVLQGSEDAMAQVRFILSGGGDNFTKLLPVHIVNTNTTPLLAVTPTYLPMDGGTQATVEVQLTTRPYGDATVEVSLPTSVGTVSPAQLTFTRDNWDTAQEVTVSAVTLDAGAEDVVGELSFVGSGGGLADVATVSVLVASTGAGQNSLVVLDSAVTLPAGTAGQVGVQLSGPPVASVSLGQPTFGTVDVAVASDDSAKVSVSPASLTFDENDWNTPKDVTLTAAASTSDDAATITLTPSGAGSDGVARQIAVSVTGVAADAPTPTALPSLRYKTSRPLMEPGGPYVRGQYVLSSAPAEPVKMSVTVATSAQLRETGYTFTTNPIVLEDEPVTLLFNESNYSDGLILATRALATAKQRFAILRYEVTEGGPLLVRRSRAEGESVGFIALDINAEDLNDVRPRFHASGISMSEGESVTIGVSLRVRPSNPITVRVVEQSALLSVSGAALNFTPQNWNVPQNITLMAQSATSRTTRNFNIYAYASGQDASPDPAVLSVEVLGGATADAPLNLAVTFGAIVPDPPGVMRSEAFREVFLTWEGPPETGTTVGFVVLLQGPGGQAISQGGTDSSGRLRLFYRTSTREVLNAGRPWTATVTRYKEGRKQASETIAFTPPDVDGTANVPVISSDSGPRVPVSFKVSFGARRTRNGVDFIDGVFSWGEPPSLPNSSYVLAFQGPFGTSAGEGRDDMGTQNTSARFELYAGEAYTASVYAVGSSDDAATLTFTTPS